MRSQRNKKHGKAQSGPGRGGKKGRSQVTSDNSKPIVVVVLPRNLGSVPPRIRVTLRYHIQATLNNVGAAFANRRYEPTYVYDVDPLLGSTSVPFFTEWGAMYRVYRVRKATIKAVFSSLEAFPCNVCICPVNFDPTANTATFQNYFSNPLSRTTALGPLTGNGVGRLTDSQTTAQFGGAADLQIIDPYCGTTAGTSPTNNWWWYVGAVGTSNFASGIDMSLGIDIEVEFFEVSTPAV